MRKNRICFYIFLTFIMALQVIKLPYLSVEAAKNTEVQIKIGNTSFQASFEDNKTTRALLKKFPAAYTMSELNGNEKYKYLSYDLPENAKQIKTIHAGDIMLYGTDCIVIFYKDFNTSYSYTRLGKITDPSGLEKAVTQGNVKVQFSVLEKKISLNRKKLTLTKGSSFQLKLINVKAKKVKWSVQNKKIATVKNGRIKAKKKGKTKIAAKYGKKKYVCKLTVTEKKSVTTGNNKPKETQETTEKPEQTEKPKETPVTTEKAEQTEEREETQETTEKPEQTEEQEKTPGTTEKAEQTEEREETQEITEETVQTEQEEGKHMMSMNIDDVEVSVAWEDNDSVRELKKIAENGEIKISMSMYGGFEQVGALGTNISRQDVQMQTEPGDIVLYSGNQIVVFYGSNTWAYTRLGRIQGLTGDELKNMLGTGNVTITIY